MVFKEVSEMQKDVCLWLELEWLSRQILSGLRNFYQCWMCIDNLLYKVNNKIEDKKEMGSIGSSLKMDKWNLKSTGQQGDARRQLEYEVFWETQGGEVKALFSKSIDIVDSNLAEVLAIREVFLIFTTS